MNRFELARATMRSAQLRIVIQGCMADPFCFTADAVFMGSS